MSKAHSPTSLDRYSDCPRQWWYYYRSGLKARAKSATLIVGIILHEIFNTIVKSRTFGTTCDPVSMFDERWAKETTENEISYSTTQTPDGCAKSGRRMAELFDQYWRTSDLVPVMDQNGEPILEREFRTSIGNGCKIMARLDILAMSTKTGLVGPIDFKTPGNKPNAIATVQSNQLSIQQLVLEPHLDELGLERIDTVGFLNVLRRNIPKSRNAKGPEVLPPSIITARTPERLAEAKRDILMVHEDIERGRFPRTPRKPYNSPCELCDYAMHCAFGSLEGLIVPDQWTFDLAA